jgi:hypothetical protein
MLCVEALKNVGTHQRRCRGWRLTYLGNLVSHISPGTHPPNVIPAVSWYCMGLLAATVAFIVSYVTQLKLYNEERARQEGRPFRYRHQLGVYLGVALALFLAISFGMGCWLAALALGA